MNSVLISNEDIVSEIKEMVKDLENIKSNIDMFGELVEKQILADSV